MPRPKRFNLKGIPQHITQRGNNRQRIFLDDQDRWRYLSFLLKAAITHHCEIHAYSLMPNHVHLLLTPVNSGSESLTMQDLGRSYVQYFNRRHDRTGTLFEGRFKSSLIDSERYCLTCYRYIELNAVRAGMVSQPGDYPWSSYRFNALGKLDPLVTPHALWLGLGQSRKERCQAYTGLFESESDTGDQEMISRCEENGLPCGSAEFIAHLENASGIPVGTGTRGRPRKTK